MLDWIWVWELVKGANRSLADVLPSLLSHMERSRVVVSRHGGCLGILRLSWRFVGFAGWRQAKAPCRAWGSYCTANKLWK